MPPPHLTVGDVARHFNCRPWQVRRLYESGRLDEPARFGAYRVIPRDELPKVEKALRAAGYLPGPEGGPTRAA
jgi:hypothetical protein